jgi:predicted RNA binding protein YcfA (HicA-like mRNA interferase family)
MKNLPSIGYDRVVSTLRREGWVIVSRRGNQLRLHKRVNSELFKVTIPAHRPIKKSTLDHILKLTNIPTSSFLE